MTHEKRKLDIIDRLTELIRELGEKEQLELLEKLESERRQKPRAHERKSCPITVYFATNDKIFRSEVRDISKAGVFINTKEKFCVGQELLMTFSFPGFGESFNFNGVIVRGGENGIGVQFSNLTEELEKILGEIVNDVCG